MNKSTEASFGEAEFAIGVAFFRQGKGEEALGHLENARDNISALGLAARIHLEKGNYERAMEMGRRAYELRPDEGPMLLLHISGQTYLATGRPLSAIQAFRKLTELAPQQAAGYIGLADAYLAIGSSYDAIEALEKAVTLAQGKGPLIKLSGLLIKIGLPARGLAAAEEVLKREPNDLHANACAGQSLVELGRPEEAALYWRKAEASATEPDWVELRHGSALSMLGQFEESEAHLNRSIQLNPRQAGAYKMIFSNRKAKDEDRPLVAQMEELLEDKSLAEADRAALAFALGKAWDDLGNPEKCFRYYDLGHETQGNMAGEAGKFRPERMVETFEAQKKLFSGPALALQEGAKEPIFVVGMMRSGTTLTEHILAAHSGVVGAGELDFWTAAERLLVDRELPCFMTELVPERRETYHRLLNEFSGDKLRVVDKFPGNLSVVGLIHHIMPNAHIVHLHRNPVDVAVSLWATYSDPFSPLTATREGIVVAIQQAKIQGDYWRKTLPKDRFLDVRYEDLVSDPDSWVRTILQFCGLPFEEECLHASESTKKVRTPSMWQVRQPVYKTSMDRWKRYEPWLGEFRDLLD